MELNQTLAEKDRRLESLQQKDVFPFNTIYYVSTLNVDILTIQTGDFRRSRHSNGR
jgi:hypothetical protein